MNNCPFFERLTQVTNQEDAYFIFEALKKQLNYSPEIRKLSSLASGNGVHKYHEYVTTEKANWYMSKVYRWSTNEEHFIYRIPIQELSPGFVLSMYNHKLRFVLANFYSDIKEGEHIYHQGFAKIRKNLKNLQNHAFSIQRQ